MAKKDNKHNFDLVTPADAVDYDPLGSGEDVHSIKTSDKIKNESVKPKLEKQIFFKQSILAQYIFIIIFSAILGLARWSFLDKDFPLFGLSEAQLKSIKIKEISENQTSELIDLKLMQKIVIDNLFPVLDARDLESYNDGHIDSAYNIDSELLIEGDEDEIEKFKSIISDVVNQGHETIVIYCWNPDCDRAEYLKAILLDDSGYYGSFNDKFTESNILIYEQGWDEWSLISTDN